MAKLTVLLMVLAATATASAAMVTDAGASIASVAASRLPRRSRFLLANSAVYNYNSPLPSTFTCSKKSAAVCLAPGSPGPACCGGQCVDTTASADHCGGCNKVCKNHHDTCCDGRCVDLLSDKDNCGTCGNQCTKKCSYGFCDYAV